MLWGRKPRPCVFCHLNHDDFRIEYQDDELAIFHDIRPAAQLHLLVVPIAHIKNINHLDATHVPMLQRFEARARDVLAQDKFKDIVGASPEIRFGFHIPPYNTVHHLHLHVLVLPFRTLLGWKYSRKCGWFARLEDFLPTLATQSRPVSPTAVPMGGLSDRATPATDLAPVN
ncbi:hypothetical protein AMAG_03033 [Allomyces macrogynus ATCC 38327]|uniref:HIT domain-containing protein n=1 Tax=Allomyces macrogynus (strain ATCC 38327) TaxID=578462 RepID=A0A0L0S440_ALLM3|nr:hypothetical protein AMAG_03033 [Allomyces macrogynus ATCC 38327]|eukprot:KNE57308.1 hypothetical protein AMAG_03033 [Allomyces macrogynus ATCC 38327]